MIINKDNLLQGLLEALGFKLLCDIIFCRHPTYPTFLV